MNNALSLLRCLYIDDDSVIRLEAEDIIGESVGALVIAKDGAEGFLEYKKGEFDVVILDISMPGMDGVELSRRIKEINPKQTIIVTSSTEDAKHMIELVNIGVNRFFSKPVNFDMLIDYLSDTAILLHNERQIKEYQELLEHKNEELQNTCKNLVETQKQLVESEKMASLGGLVSGMAHELNTPVGICVTAVSHMHGKMEELQHGFSDGALKRSALESFFKDANDSCAMLQSNLDKVAHMVQAFKQISADKNLIEDKSQIDVCQLVKFAASELKDVALSKGISIEARCEEGLVMFSYKEAFLEIVRALLSNSVFHAFEDNTGQIVVSSKKEGSNLALEVVDNGIGMNESQLKMIFLPFYKSNKSKGIGLGLSIAYNVITHLFDGDIVCESEPGKGSTMRVTLPLG